MNEQEKREKAIKGLELCTSKIETRTQTPCETCPYHNKKYHGVLGDGCCNARSLQRDALALLKAQEPHVMTLGDLRDIGSVWELNTPPYLWMEINPAYRWTRGFWVAWREIYDMIDGLHPTYDADNYGSIWRCWISRPTDEQREKVKWDD